MTTIERKASMQVAALTPLASVDSKRNYCGPTAGHRLEGKAANANDVSEVTAERLVETVDSLPVKLVMTVHLTRHGEGLSVVERQSRLIDQVGIAIQ